METLRMLTNYRLIVVGSLLLLLAGLAFTTHAHAVEVDDNSPREQITLSPVSKSHAIKSGESLKDSFKVINSGDTAFSFSVYARPFSVSGEQYEQDFVSLTERSNAYRWVQFEKTKWDIKPGDTVTVNYTLRVPEGATPGGHYGVMFAETQPKDSDDNSSVVRNKRVGSVLKVRVEGDVVEQGKQLSFDVPFLQNRPPLTSNERIENTGNVDFDVTQVMPVKDIFGRTKYADKKTQTVYPDTTRALEFNWQEVNWFGLYKVEMNSEFLDQSQSSSSYVLIAPVWLLVVAVLAVIGGGYAFFRHNR